MKKSNLLIGLAAGLAMSASATPFNNGTTDATAKVGPNVGDDYTALSAASVAFDAVVGGINANWAIEITGDISDPGYCYFGNTIAAGKKVTIKPAANTTPTVTFTATTGGGTTAGFLVIGINTNGVVGTANRFPTANAWVIDGSNNGGTSRDLTIKNSGTVGTTTILRPASDTDGMVVKNVKLISVKTSGTDNIINFANGKIGTFNDTVDTFTLTNCYLEANTNSGGSIGIAVNATNAAFSALDTTGPGPFNARGHVYTNNTILARHRGIAPLYTRDVTVIGNTIQITNPGTGASSTGIGDLLNNGDTSKPGTYIVRNNLINKLETKNATAGGGIAGITLGGGNGIQNIIQNNIVTGFNFTGATAVDQVARGIACTSAVDKYTIEHNSIKVDAGTNVTGATAANLGGIYSAANSTPANVIIRNNIIRVAYQTTTAAAGAVPINSLAILPTANVTGNCLFNASPTAGNQNISVFGANVYATIAAHQTAGYDAAATGGQSVDPTTIATPWTSDLKFLINTVPAGLLGVTATYATDIEGQTRAVGALAATAGADEPQYVPPAAANTGWTLYN